jgi:NADH:ubiquinone oxidoreductase subunit 5 (subunit L)/multisubunit Na+/H+ antiporter MnhA subunit
VNRTKDLATSFGAFDNTVIDGMGVDGSAWLTRFASRVSIWWDTWIVDGLVNVGARIVWLFSFPVRLVQNGLVQSYALLIVVGVLLFFGYYLTR